MHSWIIPIKKLLITYKHREWCQIPYPNHPNGCPKYGQEGCPPLTSHIVNMIDVSLPMYFVYSEFDLQGHVEKMKGRHPQWSDRQLRNVLYWQGTSRKQLRERVAIAEYENQTNVTFFCPEGHGVNVYATALKHGLRLERIKDLKLCHHIALMGFNKGK